MMGVLKSEQEADDSQKSFCNKDLASSANQKEDLEGEVRRRLRINSARNSESESSRFHRSEMCFPGTEHWFQIAHSAGVRLPVSCRLFAGRCQKHHQ